MLNDVRLRSKRFHRLLRTFEAFFTFWPRRALIALKHLSGNKVLFNNVGRCCIQVLRQTKTSLGFDIHPFITVEIGNVDSVVDYSQEISLCSRSRFKLNTVRAP